MATIPAFSHGPGAAPASRRPRVTQLSAASAAPASSPAAVVCDAQARAKSGTASTARGGRAPRIAQPSASAAPGGTRIRATQVSTSATLGSRAMAPTTTPIESGRTSAQRAVA